VRVNENLAPSDKGVAMMRRRLREQIRGVAKGQEPGRATDLALTPVPTYGGDTVLTMPRAGDGAEADAMSRLAHDFMETQFEADGMPESRRVEFVVDRLRTLESAGLRKHDDT
jgi:hypothetical protein